MSKKTMTVIILVLAAILLLLLVLAVVLATGTPEGNQEQIQGTTTAPVADAPDSTENPTEGDAEPTGIPGVADNPLGNNDNNDTTPPAQGNSGNNGNESGDHVAESTRPTTTNSGSQGNKPGETEPEETEPEEAEPQDTKPAGNSPVYSSVTYEQYEAMSEAEQKAFVNSFASLDDFFDWYYAAKEKYEQEAP